MSSVLARAYRRSALGYVALFVGILVAVFLVYTGASVWIFARYFTLADLQTFLLAGESGVIIGMVISAAVTALREDGLIEWLGGEVTGDRAVEAWEALVGLPARLIRRSMLIVAVSTAPLLILASRGAHLSGVVVAMLLVGMVSLNLGCGSFALTLLDIFLRPIRAKIDRALPRDFQPSHLSVEMNRRLTGEVSLLILAPAFLTAGLLAPMGGGSTAFVKSFLVSAAVAGAFSALIGQALIERITGPIRDLQRGTRAVGEGNLDVRVPLASTDEHLVLVDSFNRMVIGLREREALHSAIGSYIDPAIAKRIMAEGANIDGEAVDVTIMFVDIIGFTTLAEDASPEEIVARLNDFFEVIVPVIEDHGGHANKLLGDGLMAVFGVPISLKGHADLALAAALEMDRRMNERFEGQLRAGIGLNSGSVVVGSMGGGRKLDYTVIGDAVNVAARVEAFTRQTGDSILITEATRVALTRLVVDAQPRGSVPLKGRHRETALYAVSRASGVSTNLEAPTKRELA